MRLLAVIPVVILLACSSVPSDSLDTEQYLDRVHQMYTEYKERFGHLTSVTLAVTPQPDTPGPTPTIEQWELEVQANLAMRLADLTWVNRFQREGLAELNAMAVPEEHLSLHNDLIELWEAGIAWTDRWLVGAQEAIAAINQREWGSLDVLTGEEISAYDKIHARHVDAWARADFVLLGTPQPPPYDVSGSATAWASTPFPDVPTATLAPIPSPTTVPEPLEINTIYEVRRLKPGERLSQEEVLFIHFRSWEKLALLHQAAQNCNLYLDNFETRPVDTPEVVRLWNLMTADFIRHEEAGKAVRDATERLDADLNMKLSEEHWEVVRPVLIEAVIVEQETADSVERLLDELECPQ